MTQLSDDGLWEWNGKKWVPSSKQLGMAATATPAKQSRAEVRASRQASRQEAAAKRQEAKQAAAAAKLQAQESARVATEQRAFAASPQGRARSAFGRGDQVFQCSFDVMTQQAVIVSMIGSTTTKKAADPSEVLNAVCAEGWELITGSFVFVEEGQQSRDKLMSSGQNVAIKGKTMGYYLFKRSPKNKKATL